uniref:BHLH domain-containing protein n=1 Tax=Anopheles dirus TaxID=7168 RepID=A0A182MYQ1_9DIPT
MANPSKLNPHDRHDDYASESYLRRIKAEIRKTNKPIMEKKRRARINNYLNDLKSLLLDAMKKDPVRHSKLEKADILDLTVKHLQDVERRRLNVAMAVDPTVPEKFATGYRECIDEIGKYFDSLGTVDDGLKARVRKHLEGCLTFPAPPAGQPFPLGGPFGFAGGSPDDINNNTSSSGHGLLNRTFANNLSLMFPTGLPFPTGDASTIPFHPLSFFGPLRAATHSHPSLPTASYGCPEPSQRKDPPSEDPRSPGALTVPSPPASPRSTVGDSSEECPGTTLRTPLGKAGPHSAQHNMDRLLAIFPTPPSPEEQPSRSRLGKLGHHFSGSPFVPTGRSRMQGEDTEEEEEEELELEAGESSQGQARKDGADDGQDNPNGEMWRPW